MQGQIDFLLSSTFLFPAQQSQPVCPDADSSHCLISHILPVLSRLSASCWSPRPHTPPDGLAWPGRRSTRGDENWLVCHASSLRAIPAHGRNLRNYCQYSDASRGSQEPRWRATTLYINTLADIGLRGLELLSNTRSDVTCLSTSDKSNRHTR